MNPWVLPALFGLGVLVGVDGMSIARLDKPEPKQPLSPVFAGSVTDLIERLLPLTDYKERSWHGVYVTFENNKQVTVSVETSKDERVKVTAPTLEEAVRKLTQPLAYQKALEGWTLK